MIPLIAKKVGEIVELPPPDTSLIEGRIMRRVVLKKGTAEGRVSIRIDNYTSKDQEVSLYDISGDSAAGATVPPDFVTEMGGEYTEVWKRTLSAGGFFEVSYTGAGGGIVDMRGVAENLKVVVDVDV